MQTIDHATVTSSLPRPWEQETTFNDVLYDWMDRAPWLAISAAAHLLALFLAAAFLETRAPKPDPIVIQASLTAPPEEIIEEPEPEVLEETPEDI